MKTKLCLFCLILLQLSVCIIESKIIFTSGRKDNTDYQLFIMEDDGSDVRQVLHSKYRDLKPGWFPNGREVLFVRDFTGGEQVGSNSAFLILDVETGEERTFMENHPTDQFPALSRDGRLLAFNSVRTGIWNIYVLDLASGNVKQLTDNILSEWSKGMGLSPDGKQIVYHHEGAEGDNIWVMDADDGRPKKRLTQAKPIRFFRGTPHWSLSGRYIIYKEQERTHDIFTGAVAMRLFVIDTLTKRSEEHRFPGKTLISNRMCWMDDDKTVLLSMKADYTDERAVYDIYRYDLDTRKLTNLTKNSYGGDYHPHWIAGPLSVSSTGKLSVRWGELKAE